MIEKVVQGMRPYRFAMKAPDARVLIVSNRDIAPVVSRSGLYEFEDLGGAVDAVDLVAPQETPDPADARSPVRHVGRTLQRLGAKAFRRLSVTLEEMPPSRWCRSPTGKFCSKRSSETRDSARHSRALLGVSCLTAAHPVGKQRKRPSV